MAVNWNIVRFVGEDLQKERDISLDTKKQAAPSNGTVDSRADGKKAEDTPGSAEERK